MTEDLLQIFTTFLAGLAFHFSVGFSFETVSSKELSWSRVFTMRSLSFFQSVRSRPLDGALLAIRMETGRKIEAYLTEMIFFGWFTRTDRISTAMASITHISTSDSSIPRASATSVGVRISHANTWLGSVRAYVRVELSCARDPRERSLIFLLRSSSSKSDHELLWCYSSAMLALNTVVFAE